MRFSKAFDLWVFERLKVYRTGWNGKGMYIFFVQDHALPAIGFIELEL